VELKFIPRDPVREFEVGTQKTILSDCGNVELQKDEQITILRNSGAEFDFVAKEWGFYATPSVNGRLVKFGLRTAIVINNRTRKRFILVLEKGFEESFFKYLEAELMVVERWLDEDD
jgi:hypothetical protein